MQSQPAGTSKKPSKLFKRMKPEDSVASLAPAPHNAVSSVGLVFIVPNGEDISLAIAKSLSDRLSLKGFQIAKTPQEAQVMCLSETLSLSALRAILKTNNIDVTSKTPNKITFTSIRWVRDAVAARNSVENPMNFPSPTQDQYRWNRCDLRERILSELERESKRADSVLLVPEQFPREFESGARSLLTLIDQEDQMIEEGMRYIPLKYREKVSCIARLPSPT